MRSVFGNALATTGGRKAGEPGGRVKELDTRSVQTVEIFAILLLELQ